MNRVCKGNQVNYYLVDYPTYNFPKLEVERGTRSTSDCPGLKVINSLILRDAQQRQGNLYQNNNLSPYSQLFQNLINSNY